MYAVCFHDQTEIGLYEKNLELPKQKMSIRFYHILLLESADWQSPLVSETHNRGAKCWLNSILCMVVFYFRLL